MVLSVPTIKALFSVSFLAYLVGSIPFASLFCFLFRLPDPQSYGSKNPGATNVFRQNKALGVLTLLADTTKAYFCVSFLPYWAVSHFSKLSCTHSLLVSFVLFFVILGHIFSLFLKFRGGKGVACAIGALAAVDPVVAGVGSAIIAILIALTRYSFLGTLLGLACTLYFLIFRSVSQYILIAYLLSLVFIGIRHSENILRFLKGKENRL